MGLDIHNSEHLFVANLKNVSLEKLVESKLDVFLSESKKNQVPISGLYENILGPVEKTLLMRVLKAHGSNQTKASKALGISRNTLKRKMDQFKISSKKSKKGGL